MSHFSYTFQMKNHKAIICWFFYVFSHPNPLVVMMHTKLLNTTNVLVLKSLIYEYVICLSISKGAISRPFATYCWLLGSGSSDTYICLGKYR